jgi:hypothetical protein
LRELARAEQEREREEQRRAEDAQLDAMTPGYVRALKWGGGGVAVIGLLGVAITAAQYDSEHTTQPEYEKLRLANDLSWIGLGLGVASALVGFKLTPGRGDLKRAPVKQAELVLTPRGLAIQGAY